MADHLRFQDPASLGDLRVYLERLGVAGAPDVRLLGRGAVLAAFGSTQAPRDLGDQTPAVLVMRAVALARPTELDVLVPVRALLDRIARLGPADTELELPPDEISAAWAGVLPPRAGWEPAEALDAASLATVAREGASRVAAALPSDPGEAVLRRVRAGVWNAMIAPGIPAAAAFAADALGFLHEETRLRVSRTGSWTRLTATRGDVLIRSPFGVRADRIG